MAKSSTVSPEKRLYFTRGADEYVDGGVTFVRNGASQAVSDDQYDRLKALPDYDFTDQTPEERADEVAAEEAAAALAEANRIGSIEEQERLNEDARRRGVFYGASSQSEIDAAGVTEEGTAWSPVSSPDGVDAPTAPDKGSGEQPDEEATDIASATDEWPEADPVQGSK